jgi:hypothetical protein
VGESSGGGRGVVSKAVGCIDTDKGKGMLSSLHYNSCVATCTQPRSALHAPTAGAREQDSDDDDDEDEGDEKNVHDENKEATDETNTPIVCSGDLLLAGFESGGVSSYDLRTGRYVHAMLCLACSVFPFLVFP